MQTGNNASEDPLLLPTLQEKRGQKQQEATGTKACSATRTSSPVTMDLARAITGTFTWKGTQWTQRLYEEERS